jgi:hypothetical protein
MRVKVAGVVVLGVDNEREYCQLSACGALDSIQNECRAEALPCVAGGDGQPADKPGRQQRIAWQTFRFIGRKLGHRQTACRECIVAGNFPRGIDRDKAVAQPTTHILRNLLPEIPVECFNTAGETPPVMATLKRLDNERAGHREAEISFR